MNQMSRHIWFWYMYLSQFQEMKALVSLCKCVDSSEHLLPTYTKYRCRPKLRQLAPLRQHGQLMMASANMWEVPKSHMLVKSSFGHIIYYINSDQQLLFSS